MDERSGGVVLKRFAVWVVALALLAAGPALADTRVALVIANADYQKVAKLPNPPNDARTMAAALRQIGFSVTEKTNLSKRDLESALKGFASAAREADIAVIYYAGHGMEQGGLNYLVPVDATLASEQDIEFDAVPLDLVMRSAEGASRLKLVILDACRNNPFLTTMRRTNGTRAVSRGLTRVEPDGDMLVAYAAREGATADDGAGTDSPFTKAVAKWLTTPGVEMHLLFGKVRDDVRKATENRQEPAIYGSLGGEEYYFVPPGGAAKAAAPATVATQTVAPQTVATAAPSAASGVAAGPGAGGGGRGFKGRNLGATAPAAAMAAGGGANPYASGMAHIDHEEWAAAIADFDKVIGFRPGNAGAWHNRARAKYGAGDIDGAIADMTRAIRILPTNDDSYIARARFYRLKLLWELALADNNQALQLKPDGEAYFQRGLTYEGKGDAAAAAADYAKALSINPRMPRVIQAQMRVAKRR